MTTASVIVPVMGEPRARLERLVDAVAAQAGVGDIELVLAIPPEERAALPDVASHGAIEKVSVVDNPGGGRSSGLNRAARAASAPVVVRLDARSVPAPDHVARALARLAADPRIGVVGGVQSPVAADDGAVARGIARALRNPWLLGGAAYRRPGGSGPVDTVYLGAFRRDELLALGGYDERLAANEDFDVCQRYRHAGFTVWLEQGLAVRYEARSTVPEVWHQYVAFGRAKVRYWRLSGERANVRQTIALGGAVAGVTALVLANGRGRAGMVAAGVAGTALVDHVVQPSAALDERLVAIATYAAVNTGWVTGVVVEALTPDAGAVR